MKVLFLSIALSFITFLGFAQEFSVPKYEFSSKEAYAKYEKDVLAGIDWILKTPVIAETYKGNK